MNTINLGKIVKINGSQVVCLVNDPKFISSVSVLNFKLSYISIGAFAGTKLVDGRFLILTIQEIYQKENDDYFIASINGVYDSFLTQFSFGTNTFPLIGEQVFKLDEDILRHIFDVKPYKQVSIGTYFYNDSAEVFYNPDILFGKHLGIFGNTGSGKTCTIVSIIQNYIRSNPTKDIKFVVLDVNGEYSSAFNDEEKEFYNFGSLRFNHHILNSVEYGRLFRAAEGIQFPALKDCLRMIKHEKGNEWTLNDLLNKLTEWVDNQTPFDKNNQKDKFTKNTIFNQLRTMLYRIEQIINDNDLLQIIDSNAGKSTFDSVIDSNKKVHILDFQTSNDTLDVILYLLFKEVYERKSKGNIKTHICLVLEEAHRYINTNLQETKLGSYYIDKLAREGRKFGIGLLISSQIPSMLSYEIVSQCNTTIMHKITNKKDMEYLKSVLRISNDTFFLQMSSLEKQFAIVSGEAFSSDIIVRIKDAYPLPRSSDPVIQDKFI